MPSGVSTSSSTACTAQKSGAADVTITIAAGATSGTASVTNGAYTLSAPDISHGGKTYAPSGTASVTINNADNSGTLTYALKVSLSL